MSSFVSCFLQSTWYIWDSSMPLNVFVVHSFSWMSSFPLYGIPQLAYCFTSLMDIWVLYTVFGLLWKKVAVNIGYKSHGYYSLWNHRKSELDRSSEITKSSTFILKIKKMTLFRGETHAWVPFYPKYGPWISSSSPTWELIKNAESQPLSPTF